MQQLLAPTTAQRKGILSFSAKLDSNIEQDCTPQHSSQNTFHISTSLKGVTVI